MGCTGKKKQINFMKYHVIVLLAGVILGFSALILVHLLPCAPMKEHVYWSLEMIEKEFDDEVLIEGYRATLTGNFTDCLMLEHAVYSSDQHGLLGQVLHMYRSESCAEEGGWWPGHSLKDYLTGTPQPREVSYSRYWHGYLVFLKPLLLLTSFNTIRLLQAAVQLVFVGAGTVILCRKGAYSLAKALLISLPFLSFVSTYASLSLSVCFYVMMAAVLIQLKINDILLRRRWYGLFFFAVGMAVAYFDFLTYPLVTLIYPLGIYLYFCGGNFRKNMSNLLKNSMEWSAGYVGMWAAKWILTDCLTGSSCIQDALRTIFVRTGSAEGYSRIKGFFSVLGKNIQPFLNWCYILILVVSAVYILVGALKNAKALKESVSKMRFDLSGAGAYFVLALYPLAWYFLAQNHSEQHWQFTCRILAASVFAVVTGIFKLLEPGVPAQNPKGTL